MIDWTGILTAFIASLFGSAIPVIGGVFWLGGMAEKIRALMEKCKAREQDHCHHYHKINEHDVRIGNIDTRVVSLEQWRAREEA